MAIRTDELLDHILEGVLMGLAAALFSLLTGAPLRKL